MGQWDVGSMARSHSDPRGLEASPPALGTGHAEAGCLLGCTAQRPRKTALFSFLAVQGAGCSR